MHWCFERSTRFTGIPSRARYSGVAASRGEEEKTLSTVTTTYLIQADIESVWAQLADIRLVANWHPAVATVDLLSESPTGLGATRRCNFYDGTNVIEEFVEQEVNKRLRVEIRDFNGPIKNFKANWHLTETTSGATQVRLTMNYDMKFSILGTVMDALVIKGRMPKLLNKVLAGLDHHVVNGEIINQQFAAAA